MYIVDDDVIVRRSVALLLRGAGYTVHPFSSGSDFLEAAAYLAPGCVLLDVYMPDLNGLTVQERCRRDRRDLAVVFMTGYGDVRTAVAAMQGGAFSFIEKPFDDDALLAVMDQVFAALPQTVRQASNRAAAHERIEALSRREREVLSGLMAGYSNKVIALRLDVGLRTVETHRANTVRKLGARGVGEMVQLGLEAGLEPMS